MSVLSRPAASPAESIPPLENGDRLTRAEFERRYDAMPHLKKAELLEGVVYMGSPVAFEKHGNPHLHMGTLLDLYSVSTPGVRGGGDTSVRLDLDNMPQPDVCLIVMPSHGGRVRIGADDYIEGAPELIVEVASSSVSIDLHTKFEIYRRNGVGEYVIWRVRDRAIDWFANREGRFERLPRDPAGPFKSQAFPGLWVDPDALTRDDMVAVLETLHQGLASPEHAAFVAALGRAARPPQPVTGEVIL